MTPNQIVVVWLELVANERFSAVIATRMRTESNQSEWPAVLTALTYRAEALRQQLAHADPANIEAAHALMAASTPTTPEPPATPALPAWTRAVSTAQVH